MARLSQRELTEAEHSTFAALCQRRLQREPLQYILGEQSFLGRSFHVDSRVLIPRPETELLAERAIAALKRFQDAPRALDLCCGSGCLGASLALRCLRPGWRQRTSPRRRWQWQRRMHSAWVRP